MRDDDRESDEPEEPTAIFDVQYWTGTEPARELVNKPASIPGVGCWVTPDGDLIIEGALAPVNPIGQTRGGVQIPAALWNNVKVTPKAKT
jgi:hypothetical protein